MNHYSTNYYLEKQNKTKKQPQAGYRTNLFEGKTFVAKDDPEYLVCHLIYRTMKAKALDTADKADRIATILSRHFDVSETSSEITKRLYTGLEYRASNKKPRKARKKAVDTTAEMLENKRNEMKVWVKKLHDFLSEFQMPASFRMVSTLAYVDNPTNYILNYFKIQDNPYAVEIQDKLESVEWQQIADAFRQYECTQAPINNRIKIYYGEPGTGKTTEAVAQADFTKVCSADMLPSDLMQDFDFEKGQPTFRKSELWLAIEEGKTICLDEINLLPQESLCFIQALTDGKESFDYKGSKIKVHPDFNIIGTMNLVVNGVTLPLTSPLADRCSNIIEYKLEPEKLVAVL